MSNPVSAACRSRARSTGRSAANHAQGLHIFHKGFRPGAKRRVAERKADGIVVGPEEAVGGVGGVRVVVQQAGQSGVAVGVGLDIVREAGGEGAQQVVEPEAAGKVLL